MNTIDTRWTCPTCMQLVQSPFCPRCGERPLAGNALSLRGVAAKIVHATTSIDGKVLRSFRQLLLRPGDLSLAYVEGRRMPYVAPFQLFLLANAFFFAMQSLTGTNIFSSTLESHLHHQDWSDFAQTLVARRLQALHTTLDLYAPIFDRAVVLYAKSLIILMVLPFALLLPLVFAASRRPFMTHLVFAVHLYTFLLLLFSLALLAAKAEALLGGAGLASPRVDNALSVINLLACAAYLYAASKPVYAPGRTMRVVATIVLAVLAGAIVIGYRFVLLLITLYAA